MPIVYSVTSVQTDFLALDSTWRRIEIRVGLREVSYLDSVLARTFEKNTS